MKLAAVLLEEKRFPLRRIPRQDVDRAARGATRPGQ
jgi:hypothetical protein